MIDQKLQWLTVNESCLLSLAGAGWTATGVAAGAAADTIVDAADCTAVVAAGVIIVAVGASGCEGVALDTCADAATAMVFTAITRG